MERKKDWKDFQTIIEERPDYRTWLREPDPEKRELRSEYIELISKINGYRARLKEVPMPSELNDIHFSRSALHIDQDSAVSIFMEILLHRFLQEESAENRTLLFAFLEHYAALLEKEWNYCRM